MVSPRERRRTETNGPGVSPPTGSAGWRAPATPALRGLRPVILLVGVLMTVGALHLGRSFLMPVAVAGLLTFLLSPIVRFFERWLPRAVAVLLVVVLTFSVLGALAWALVIQAASLGGEIPAYRDNLKRKIAEVRGASRGNVVEKVQSATKEVVEELQKEETPVKTAEKPMPVVVKPTAAAWQPALLEAFGNVGLVVVLVIFMLLERLQLRDRLIRLIGFGRIATTTKAMDEAARRISHYLTMQTVVNGTFGIGVSLGLLAIGLPYAFLWGTLAAVLRFIPYVGPWAAALGVTLAGLAVFDGWLQPAVIAGLFVVLELFTNMVLETYLYSQSAGVSQVVLLLAIAFWTWIWGPVGLALATPLMVCLVVLAKYVPDLELVSMLLSDEPVMERDRSYYQRLVARDENEAEGLVNEYLESHPAPDVFDEVFVPALNHARGDHQRGRITDADARFIERTTRELVEELDVPRSPADGDPRPAVTVLGLPGGEEADEVALLMLKQRLDPERFTLDVASPDLLASEAIALVEASKPGAVVIGALAGAGHALHLRYLCKRLRSRFPDLPILVGWWGADGGDDTARDAMMAAGADRVTVTVGDACVRLQELVQLDRAAAWPSSPASAAPAGSATQLRDS
ncbi:MAG TPA: AI-2E family transporter [Methylomirabilota bacterium]|jgi:predicted PurR-regulated permease PerM|nr:AI-2E family transporter [Methylomirabilota bacterium]